MPHDMEFANRTAVDLVQILAQRVEAEVSPQTDQERFQALMGPVVGMLAILFQDTVERSPTPRQTVQRLMDFYGSWICTLLSVPEDSQ
ncbi:MAG TPA: hypothetical protein VNL98_10850 [Gemmatimonadales bacterium]|nr:hypothetical protein [Gemmatimonadales bacterium]